MNRRVLSALMLWKPRRVRAFGCRRLGRSRWLAGVGLAVWLAFAGTAGAADVGNDSIAVEDFTGHVVRLAHPARRIVALTPHLVENLYTAGLGDRLVAAVRYSDYPAAAAALPRVGGYRSVSLEAIVAKRPDLVVAWGQSGMPDIVQRLRALGIAVYVDNPVDFSGIARTIRDLGRLGGTQVKADRAADDFLARMQALRGRYADQRSVSTFFAVSVDPLITIAGQSMIGAAIRLCGGDNIYADADVAAPRVGIESLVARNPAVIIAADPAPDWPAYWQRWPSIDAVANDRFVTVPRSEMSRPTVRMAHATAVMCRGIDRVRRSQHASSAQAARSSAN